MADDSGQMRFVALDSAELRDGNVLKIVNGEVTELVGERVFVITDRSYLMPVKYEEMTPIKRLAELKSGEKGINLLVAVLVAELKRVGSRFVLSGTLSDESGKLPFTSWGPHLEEGAIARIENAYVKSWNGMPTVNVGEASVIYEIEREVPPRLTAPQDVSISELATREGAYDVMVAGSVISIKPSSGVIQRCPTCGRTVHAARCPSHGAIVPTRDFRIKALIDDGTGAMTAIIGRRPAERMYEQLITQGMAARQATSLRTFEDNRGLLLGMTLSVRGDATTREYGTTFVVKDATVERDGKARIEQIKKRLESLRW
jgi:replication factor A1